MPFTRGLIIHAPKGVTHHGAAPPLLERFLKESTSLWYPWRIFGIPLTLIVALLDFYTGNELQVSVLYLVPISLASWKLGKGEAVFVASFSALIWFVEDALLVRQGTSFWIPFLNMLALLGVFLTVVLSLSALRSAFAEQERLIRELEDALGRVKTLTGLLPMCSWCKKVRDDQGYWKAVEAYIHEYSNAEVTHGICPECKTSFLAKGTGFRDVTS